MPINQSVNECCQGYRRIELSPNRNQNLWSPSMNPNCSWCHLRVVINCRAWPQSFYVRQSFGSQFILSYEITSHTRTFSSFQLFALPTSGHLSQSRLNSVPRKNNFATQFFSKTRFSCDLSRAHNTTRFTYFHVFLIELYCCYPHRKVFSKQPFKRNIRQNQNTGFLHPPLAVPSQLEWGETAHEVSQTIQINHRTSLSSDHQIFVGIFFISKM